MNGIEWTKEDLFFLVNNFRTKSNKELSEILNRSQISIRSMKNKLGIKNSCFPRDNINENYFNVDSSNMYYILGIIISDGYLSKRGSDITFGISRKDRSLLEFICSELQYDKNHIRNIERTTRGVTNPMSILTLHSKRLVSSLSKFGLNPGAKTGKEILPEVPDEYKWDLLRRNI